MNRLRAVVVKELRQIRRDPFSLVMLIALPAFMLVLYGFALNFDVRHVRLAVQDRDRSAREPRAGGGLHALHLLRPGRDAAAPARTWTRSSSGAWPGRCW